MLLPEACFAALAFNFVALKKLRSGGALLGRGLIVLPEHELISETLLQASAFIVSIQMLVLITYCLAGCCSLLWLDQSVERSVVGMKMEIRLDSDGRH